MKQKHFKIKHETRFRKEIDEQETLERLKIQIETENLKN